MRHHRFALSPAPAKAFRHEGLRLAVETAAALFAAQVVLTYAFAWTGMMGVVIDALSRRELLYTLVVYAAMAIAGFWLASRLRGKMHVGVGAALLGSFAAAFILSVFDLLLPFVYALVPLAPGAAAVRLDAIYADPNFYVSYLLYGTIWAGIMMVFGSLLNVLLVRARK